MKNILLSLALLAALSTVSLAGDIKVKKVKSATKANAKTECTTGAHHACCMKKAQV